MGHLLGDADRTLTRTARRAALRGLDPRTRIIAAAVFAAVVVALNSLPALAAALGMALALLPFSGLAPGGTLKRMAMMDGFILVMLVTLPITTPGAPLADLPFGLVATREGLHLAAQIALTANAVILALMVLVGTMDAVVLGHALARLGAPLRLVHLLLFTVRYIEVLRAEYRRARQAMRARAFRPRSNLHSWRSFGHLVGMLLVRALERSERILQAMKCRGFTGQIPLLDDLRWQRCDLTFGLAWAACLLALTLWEITRVHAA